MSVPHPSTAAAQASGASNEGSSKELFKWQSLLLPFLLLEEFLRPALREEELLLE